MSTSADREPFSAPRPRFTVQELLAAKGTRPITSADDYAADTFSSDEELDEFVKSYREDRQRDLS